MEKNKVETLSAVCTKNQNSKKPLLMVAILGKLLTKNRQVQMLITFEPFIRFLQMKAQKSSYIELYLMVQKQQASPVIDF